MKRKDCVNSRLTRGTDRGPTHISVSLALAVLPVAAIAGPEPVQSVRLWPSAVVADGNVRLRDVAELRGFDHDASAPLADTLLGDIIEPGGSRIIALGDVRELLAVSAANMASIVVKGAAECVVHRPAAESEALRPAPLGAAREPAEDTSIPAGVTLREIINRFFDAELSAYGARADLQFGRTSAHALSLSEPEHEFQLERKPGPPLGLASVEVTVRRGGEELQRLAMVVSVAMLREVTVARRGINKGAAIEEEDVLVVARRFTRPEETGLTDPGVAIGQRARRFIAEGEVIQSRDLERVPLVKRGQMVEVVSRVGNVTVRTAAKAADDGGYDESVALHLPGRKRDGLSGRVSGPRRVEVGAAAGDGVEAKVLAQGERP